MIDNCYPHIIDNMGNYFEIESYLERIDLDKERKDDIKLGKGFQISQYGNIKKDISAPFGIFTRLFGPTLDDMNEFIEDIKCQCGYLMGAAHKGDICPICGHEVKEVKGRYDMFGWICIDDEYCIIHPNLYKELESFMGGNDLENIIEPYYEKDINGYNTTKRSKKRQRDRKEHEIYFGKGILFLRDNFDEIMKYYLSIRKDKKDKYDDLMKEKEKIFCHSIPVFTTLLRPWKVDGGSFAYNDVNPIYNMMVKLASNINMNKLKIHKKLKPKLQLLSDLQKKFNRLYSEIEEILSGKKGIFRQLFGGRFNFSARDVIIPDDSLDVDQVKLSYFALVNILEQRITNILVKSFTISYNEAHDIWYQATIVKDPRVVNIINKIIENSPYGIPILINRPPTIAYGSILQMFVVGILEDSYTMALPLQILPELVADFDGDALSILAIINKAFLDEAFKVLNPKNAFYISRNDGLFNPGMNHARDVIINTNTLIYLARDNYPQEEIDKINALRKKYNAI